ncbi:MAG: ATPase, T2SS/T4P/T4SS family [Pirellulales bacterium]
MPEMDDMSEGDGSGGEGEQESAPSVTITVASGYLNPFKLVGVLILFWIWVYTATWVSNDCIKTGLPPDVWVTVNVVPFILLAWPLVSFIPLFIGYAAMIALYMVPLLVYVKKRNPLVPPHEAVFTADHFRFLMSRLSGGKVDAVRKEAWEEGPAVDFRAMGGDETTNNTNLYNAKKSPEAYVWVKELVADIQTRRSRKLLMDFTKDSVTMRYFIDGVWHNGEARDRESSDLMLALLKSLANLNPEERRARQDGEFGANYQRKKMVVQIMSQGTKTGERVLMEVKGGDEKFDSLEALGMRDKMIEQLKEIMLMSSGLVVFSTKPEGGLSTSFSIALNSTDRLVRDFVGLEPEGSEEPEIMQVTENIYDIAGGKKPEEMLPTILRTQPEVVVMRQMENLPTFEILAAHASEKILVFTSVRAREAVEAILRLLAMKIDASDYAPIILASVNMRLCRKLCSECKEAFQPSPQLLQKLGIPAGTVETLYKVPSAPGPEDPPRDPCTQCGDVGYFGQTGIFELAKVDDGMRQVITNQPKLEALRAASKKAGNRTLQEEAILMVVNGVTSLEEIGRALKE